MLLCKPFSWTCMFAVMSSDVSQESAQSDVETYSTTPHYSKEDAMRKCHDIVEAIMEFYPSDPVDFCKAIDAAHKNKSRTSLAAQKLALQPLRNEM